MLKKGGSDRASKHFNNKDDAISFAKKVSQNQNTELVVHRKDGTIQNPNSYGGDPLPPRDRKH